METGTLTLIFLLTICLILGVSLVIVIQDLFKLEKRLQKSDEENNGYKNALQKEADIVLDDAHKRAMHVVDEANRKAMDIVSSSEDYNAESKQALKDNLAAVTKAESDQLNRVGEEMLGTYQSTLQEVQKEGSEVIHTITKDLEARAAQEVSDFSNTIKQETLDSQKVIQERMNAEYEAAKKEVEAYKQSQMKKAQDDIYTLVRFLTDSVLKKGLTVEQHQSLVTEALEEAKSQGVLAHGTGSHEVGNYGTWCVR